MLALFRHCGGFETQTTGPTEPQMQIRLARALAQQQAHQPPGGMRQRRSCDGSASGAGVRRGFAEAKGGR